MDIRLAQKHAWQNKLAKGFNTTDVPLEFCLLNSEVAEAFDAWRRDRPDVAEELADIAIFLFGLAEMVGTDLQEAVEAKLAVNEARVYTRLPNGVLVKDAAAAPASGPSVTVAPGGAGPSVDVTEARLGERLWVRMLALLPVVAVRRGSPVPAAQPEPGAVRSAHEKVDRNEIRH